MKDITDLAALKRLALLGALNSPIEVTTARLGRALGISQQGASRIMIALESKHLIERKRAQKGQSIAISRGGREALAREYMEYRAIFEKKGDVRLRGIVFSGLGEGRYYISQPGYRKQFVRKLKYRPYEGTLNVRVIPSDMPLFERIGALDGIRIEGFESNGRTFGEVKCLPAEIGGKRCSLIMPARTHYTDVMEIIAPSYLRGEMKLRDGDEVEVRVQLEGV